MTTRKDLKKKGKESFGYRIEQQHNISVVCWYDNRAVTLASTHICVDPQQTATRWDKTQKKQLEIPMPLKVSEYNQHMGGVDMLDSFLAK